jgi:uncharacterized protein YjbI with pentapeptide repeats
MNLDNTREPIEARDANLAGSRFSNVNLAGAAFDDVCLRDATLDDINLAGATLHNVNLQDVRVSDADTRGMTINGVPVHEFVRAAECGSARGFTGLVPVLRVTELQRSIDWYTSVVGMQLLWRKPQDGGGETCMLREGPVTLMLSTGSHLGGAPAFTGTLYFNMTDSTAFYGQIKAGANLVWPLEDMDYGTTEFGIRDPDGYVLAFASPRASAA